MATMAARDTFTRDDFFAQEMALRKEMFYVEFPPDKLPVWRYPGLDGCILYDLDPNHKMDRRARREGAILKLQLQKMRDTGVRWGYRHYEWDSWDVYIWPNLQYDPICPVQYRPTLEDWLRFVRDTYSERASKARTLRRTAAIKEELMAAAWHPDRVMRALEAGIEPEDM
jgi:hypothetical protein